MEPARTTDPLPQPQATGLTATICGVATLALAMVLGFSVFTDAPAEEAPIAVITQPPAADLAAFADAVPFDPSGCPTVVASRR